MGTIVKSIKILIGIVVLFLVLTYAVSLNMEIGFVRFGSPIISNTFLFTLFSGVFASALVVLMCELYKYHDTKKRMENSLYMQFAFLYGQLLIIRNNIGRVLQDPTEQLPNNMLQLPASNAAISLNNLKGLEFCTLKGKSLIERSLQAFIADGVFRLESFLMDCTVLDMAICEDKIQCLQEGIHNPVITAASEKSHAVLSVLNKRVEAYINEVDSVLIEIDNACASRFSWTKYRNAMSQTITFSKSNGVDGFIAKYN